MFFHNIHNFFRDVLQIENHFLTEDAAVSVRPPALKYLAVTAIKKSY